nr:hemin uptake protein HemP [Zoogloeaceae bacterium]
MVDEPAADEAKTISVPADSEGRLARDAAEPAINSEKLFRGRSSVLIRHGGVTYVLRATRAGKLILTK